MTCSGASGGLDNSKELLVKRNSNVLWILDWKVYADTHKN